MKNLSGEELLNEFYDTLLNVMVPRDQYFKNAQAKHAELLSRLERGRKAIEALERIEQHAYRPIREVNHSCDYMYAIDDIKQIIKEATDDRG